MTPTLTLNAGLRWDVQMPFAPSNDTMTTASLADVCGVSGLGTGRPLRRLQLLRAGIARRQGSGVRAVHERNARLQHRLEQPRARTSARRGGPMSPVGWLRTLLGDPEQATLRGGYSVAYERQGIGGFTGIYGPNPGSTLSLTRDANTGLVGPGESWPVLLRETESPLSGAVSRDADVPDSDPAEPRRQTSTRFIPTSRSRRRARGRSACSARSPRTWRSRRAMSAPAASISGQRSTTTSGT